MRTSRSSRDGHRRPFVAAVAVAALGVIAAACGSSSPSTTPVAATHSPIKVGMVYSQTGLLAVYGQEFRQGFTVGLDYATHGTDSVDGHPIQVSWANDNSTVATGVAAAKTFIGQGYQILAGTQDSGVADALSTLAAQNHVLYIVGDAADDSLTGANRYTFRAGRQTAQDVLTAKSFLTAPSGKSMLVFAQDYAFGTSYLTDAQSLLEPLGLKVSSILVPLTATDFTPYALRAKQAHPDILFVAWAGATTAPMWTALSDQGVLSSTRVVTGLAQRSTYDLFGAATTHIHFLSLYFYQCCHNAANDFLIAALRKQGTVPDLFDSDGFVTAQMIVHAVSVAKGDDVNKMIDALQGWTFLAPKGIQTIRAADHAMLQPMFQAKLEPSPSGGFEPVLIRTLTAAETAPPIVRRVG